MEQRGQAQYVFFCKLVDGQINLDHDMNCSSSVVVVVVAADGS